MKQVHNRRRSICRRALAALLLALALGAFALAEAPMPTGVPYDNDGWNEDEQVMFGLYWPLEDDMANQIYTLKSKLDSYGYYELAGINREETNASLQLNALDNNAFSALHVCCEKNGLPDRREGVTYGAFDRITAGRIINLNAPEETVAEVPKDYEDILFGQEGGDNFRLIVAKLVDLGYLNNRDKKVYDEEVRDAIALFGEYNNYRDYYAGDAEGEVRPIEVALQRDMLASDTAFMPKPEPTQPPYFAREVALGGLKAPMWAVWGAGLLVAVGCVVLLIYLFMPSDKKDKKKKRIVHFTITCFGKTDKVDLEIVKTLKIGRGVEGFPLNLNDDKVSRRHCELFYKEDSENSRDNLLMLQDYSTNGTEVNGKTVHNTTCPLKSGDTITVGNHTITVEY